MQSLVLLALSAFISLVSAQDVLSFGNSSFVGYYYGTNHTIYWTMGSGAPVSVVLQNSTWAETLLAGAPAGSSSIWEIPSNLTEGTYYVQLSQSGAYATSPAVEIGPTPQGAAASTTAVVAAVTSTTVTAPGCTGPGSMSMTVYTYYDMVCGCTKTAKAPVSPTGVPGAMNYSVPATPTPAWSSQPWVAQPTGGAVMEHVSISGLLACGVLGFVLSIL